jgi:site-specific recombinase XerD
MIDELFAKFEGAFAENTIRAYRADFNRFSQWCTERNMTPLEAGPEDLAHFIEHLAETAASSTIKRHVNSLGTIFRLSDRPDLSKAPAVVLALKRMYRQKGRAQKQAIPLTCEVLGQLLGVCGYDDRGVRDAVMLRLGYETMRRRAEMCSFRFEDLEVLPNGRAALHLRFSKTDQMGLGKLIPISPELRELLDEWSRRTGGTGPLLRRINNLGINGDAMHPGSINRRLHELQAMAGLKLGGKLSGHSFRVGAALDLLESGESLEKIMLRGGWQAESTVIKYLRAWQAV